MRQSKIINIGDVFHYWTVTSKPFRKEGQTFVQVVCKCGTKRKTRVSRLFKKTSTSCGCKKKPKRKNTLSLENAAHKEIFRSIKNGAIDRDYCFNLIMEDVIKLINDNCYYCGDGPSNLKKIKGKGEYRYNGIDRVRNNEGYTINNCVTCCSLCNTMKLTLSTSEFLEHLEKIKNNNKIKDNITEKKLIAYNARAIAVSTLSHDIHTKVGALLINNKTLAVMAEGYNGFVRGAHDSVIPTSRPEKYDYIIHAEINLICNAVRSGVQTDEATLYCMLSPCSQCLRCLWQAGISNIYFKEKYKDFDNAVNMLDLEVTLNKIGDFNHMVVRPRKHETK